MTPKSNVPSNFVPLPRKLNNLTLPHKLPDCFEVKLFLPKSWATNLFAILLVLLNFGGDSDGFCTCSGSGSSVSFSAPSVVQIQVQRHFSSWFRFVTYFGHFVLGKVTRSWLFNHSMFTYFLRVNVQPFWFNSYDTNEHVKNTKTSKTLQ